jgi:hypothetical protein
MKRIAYVMDERARAIVTPAHAAPPPDGRCETCGRWWPYLALTWPAVRWECRPCARPLTEAELETLFG